MTRTDQNREDGTERTALLSNYSDSSSLSTRTASASLSSWSTAVESSGVRSYGTVSDSDQNGINNTRRTVDIGTSAVEAEVHNRSEATRTNFDDIEVGDNLQQQEDRDAYENASNVNQSVAETDVGGRVADNASGQRQQEGRTTEETAAGDEPRDGEIGNLTRRLRCLFRAITWPIFPLGTVVSLAFLWVMYASSSLDLREKCSHPLHSYAFTSLALVVYIQFHSQVRSRIFHYSRERDGPMRPARVRLYDQFFHIVCVLYVYTGFTLIQSCRADMVDRNLIDIANSDLTLPNEGPLNTCQATCPNLYQAMSVYVITLELFTFTLILPLCFLPCIYVWFSQRATEEAEELQDRLQEMDALLKNGGITTGEILDSLEVVKIVSRPAMGSSPRNTSNDTNEDPVTEEELESQQLWILPDAAKLNDCIGVMCDVKECCICMSEFDVEVEEDQRGQDTSLQKEDNDGDRFIDENEIIVRTRCGHIFHKECLKHWVGGMWSANPYGSPLDWKKRKARQIYCPLCREDLRPTPRNSG